MTDDWKPFSTAPKDGRPIIMFRPSAPMNKWVVVKWVAYNYTYGKDKERVVEVRHWLVCGSGERFHDGTVTTKTAWWTDLPPFMFRPEMA